MGLHGMELHGMELHGLGYSLTTMQTPQTHLSFVFFIFWKTDMDLWIGHENMVTNSSGEKHWKGMGASRSMDAQCSDNQQRYKWWWIFLIQFVSSCFFFFLRNVCVWWMFKRLRSNGRFMEIKIRKKKSSMDSCWTHWFSTTGSLASYRRCHSIWCKGSVVLVVLNTIDMQSR